jgi:putative protease
MTSSILAFRSVFHSNSGMKIPSPSVELLAPAGSMASLRAAVDAGADAVFFGTDQLNMRARSKSFALESLTEVTGFLHTAGRKAYLTLNTIVYEEELSDLPRILEACNTAKIDAVIASDFAVIREAAHIGIPVHVSTQMSVSNSATAAFLATQGVKRIVLARECGLDSIREIHRQLQSRGIAMELEAFAHGAMCVAVSGRCFMSGFETGRSANRGDCAQSCRRNYRIEPNRGGNGFEIEDGYVLSPQDLCTLPFFEQLIDAGIGSLKIEGRNRSPDYVYTVVKAYRRCLNILASGNVENLDAAKKEGLDEVRKVYNRGFSSGFYLGKPLDDWSESSGNLSSHKRDYIGQIKSCDPTRQQYTLRLEAADIEQGDEVFAESDASGHLAFTVPQLIRDGAPASSASKGETVVLHLPTPLHPEDRIYRLIER